MLKSDIVAVLTTLGWSADRYGNYLPSTRKDLRVHFNKISVRIERKVVYKESTFGYTPPPEWQALSSAYFKDVCMTEGKLNIGGKLFKDLTT